MTIQADMTHNVLLQLINADIDDIMAYNESLCVIELIITHIAL